MTQHLDHVQTTTLAHRLQATSTSVVETQPMLMEHQASHTHSIMNECSTRDYVLPLHTFLSLEAIMHHTVFTLGYRTPRRNGKSRGTCAARGNGA